MAVVELAVSLTMEQADAERVRKAFARRTGNPDATLDVALAFLRSSMADQLNAVVVAEERSAIEDSKAAVKPIAIG